MKSRTVFLTVIALLILIIGFLACEYYRFVQKEEIQKIAFEEESIRQHAELKSAIMLRYQDSLAHEREKVLRDSMYQAIAAEQEKNDSLTATIKETNMALLSDSIYTELYCFDNMTNLQSQFFSWDNILKWKRTNPSSRTVLHIPYGDSIKSILIFSITGADKIQKVKSAINTVIQNSAEAVLTVDKRMRLIAGLLYGTNFIQRLNIMETETSVDRNLNIFVTDFENAEIWRSNPKSRHSIFYRFDRKIVLSEILEKQEIARNGLSICIENPSQSSSIDFAIQVIGICQRSNRTQMLARSNTQSPISMQSGTIAQGSVSPKGVAEASLPIPEPLPKVTLFKCKPYRTYVGDFIGIQLLSSPDCETAYNRLQEFKTLLTTKEAKSLYLIESKMDGTYKVIWGKYNDPAQEHEARDMANQIRRKFPKDKDFKGAMITRYAKYMHK